MSCLLNLTKNYLFWTILSLITLTTYNVLANIFTQKSKDQQAFAAIFNINASFIALFLLFFANHKRINTLDIFISPGPILLIPITTIVLYGIADIIKFIPAKELPPSTLQIIFSITTVVSTALSFLLYRDVQINILKVLAIITIIFINVYLAKNTHEKHTNTNIKTKALLFAILLALIYGIAGALDKLASQIVGLNFYNFLVWTGPTIIVLLISRSSLKNIKKEIQTVGLFKILILSLLNVLNYYFFLQALQRGPAFNILSLLGLISITTFLAESLTIKPNINRKEQAILVLASTIASLIIIT